MKSRTLVLLVGMLVMTTFAIGQSSLQWNLQEGAGLTVADELGTATGGFLPDMAQASWQAYASGEKGVQFDNLGATKSIISSDALLSFGQQWTFEAWVKVIEIDTSKASSILYLEKTIWSAPKKEQMRGGIKVKKGSDDDHIALEAFLGYGYEDGTEGGGMEWVNLAGDTELELGAWAHLAVVRDGNDVALTLNGSEIGFGSQALVPEAQTQLGWVVIGCNKDMDGGSTKMDVARVAVTPRALNSDNFILAPVVPDLDATAPSALQWNLQEGAGLQVADALGSATGGFLPDMAHASWQAYASGENGVQFDNLAAEKSILSSDALLSFGQQWTFEAWVKVIEIDTSKASSILYLEKTIWSAPKKEQMRGGIKVKKGSDDDHIALEAFLGYGYEDGTEGGGMEWVNLAGDTELELGAWAHLAVIRDGNDVALTLNGSEIGFGSQALVPEAQAQLGWVVLGCNKDMDGGSTKMDVARAAVTPRALNADNFILAPIVPNLDATAPSALQWNLQEGAGLQVADALGSATGGFLPDMAQASWQAYASGEKGVQFDNLDATKSILSSDALVNFGQQWTFEAWVKVIEIDTSKASSILYLEKTIWSAPKKEQMRGGIKAKKGSDDDHIGLEAFLGYGYEDGTEGGGMEWVNLDGDTELELGVWAHLAVVRDGNDVALTLNGSEIGFGSQALVPEAQTQLGWVVLGCNKDMDGGSTKMDVARTAVTPRALNSDNFILAPIVPDLGAAGPVVSVEDIATIGVPEGIALAQNYPNPFNPSTNIQFQIPASSTVTLRIYNVQGQTIKTLVSNQSYQPGNYDVVWDGTNNAGHTVSAGIYLYELKTADMRLYNKMIFTK